MDWRIIVVLLPLALAAGWAVFNIGAVAISQLQNFLAKRNQV